MDGTMPGPAEQAHAQLVHRVRTLPVPTVPPRYPYVGTSIGVGLLDAAINLDHVVRRIERLRIVDLTHLSRDVTVHLSLDHLTPPQRAAAVEYGERRERAHSPLEGPPIIWVPITRVNRLFVSPVRILDNEGREVPRATQPELLPLINAAMYRLLRLVLIGQPESHEASIALGKEGEDTSSGSLHRVFYETDRARWLLQQAVASMIYDAYQVRSTRDVRRGDEHSADRQDALDVVTTHLAPDKQAAFLELLHHASTEYLVLAGLTSAKKEHYLSYRAAALPSRPSRWPLFGSLRGLRRGLWPLGCEFTLRYETQLPPHLESFHVTVEAGGQTRIREAILATAHDESRCGGVVTRLRTFGEPRADLPEAIRRYEVGAALVDLATLVDARMNDADGYLMQFEQGHPRLGSMRKRHVPNDQVADLSRTLGSVGHERLRAGDYGSDISELAGAVEALDLGTASVMDDDPQVHVAHMFWRRRRPSHRTLASRDATADIQVVVADQLSPLSRSIVAWLGVLFALVAVMGALVFGRFGWPLPNPLKDVQVDAALAGNLEANEAFDGMQTDALVAVLLVVPGLLLTRVGGLPVKRSLSSRLRMLESLAAFVAVVATATLALIVATRLENRALVYRSFGSVLAVLAGLLIVACIERVASNWKESRSRLHLLKAPRWLHDRPSRLLHPIRSTRPRRFDAEFESVAQWSAMQQFLRSAAASAAREPRGANGA